VGGAIVHGELERRANILFKAEWAAGDVEPISPVATDVP